MSDSDETVPPNPVPPSPSSATTDAGPDREANRLSARAVRYARVGARVGGVAARIAGTRILGLEGQRGGNAAALAAALGGLKGPIMKVAQLMATIPDALPPEYAAELATLQNQAPPMGWAFVKRRMIAELGPDWMARFSSFDKEPTAAASLGQVHRARALDGTELAVKLQYPDMQSAVEADLKQLDLVFALHRRMDPAIDTTEIAQEIGARVREELDYRREALHAGLYALMLADEPGVRVPGVHSALSTGRLLTLDWLEGRRLLDFVDHSLEQRNTIARAMFAAWWLPFSRHGVIHGDPHLGNYTVFEEEGAPAGINLLDYGCIRIFPPSFVGGVVDLYRGLEANDEARTVHAYETWGFRGLSRELIEVLNIWARFIYGPLLDDRVRTIADGVAPGEYGRREAFRVHKALKERGPVKVPREFVFMDRAAIGLGGVFLHLKAELNFHALFEAAIEGFSVEAVTARQGAALAQVGLT
ncbi:putative unusual protein kinase regulating ubiquinone biosynthesis (AarF/ABC1/UbiB family) [Angulomicrobium tetraedrale]|uniref:Putative unusual protein kinase regulating ubiquinone biosynthesis (AarF/ABC1/UbiB family) n=1 Tax=Ancylobacter tetraedralis TaxID=217068 RepID=A0A839ZEM1_9HYPH|nr:putative unusual protein kinase regulating ubiquinone biosynthesis (AarF/ABC1/UbiB family) [Ancylobacter tetraedralis]